MLRAPLLLQFVEVWGCDNTELRFPSGMGTVQADYCTNLALRYATLASLGAVVHQVCIYISGHALRASPFALRA